MTTDPSTDSVAAVSRGPRATPWVLPGALGAVLLVLGVAGPHTTLRGTSIVLQVLFLAFFFRHLALAVAAAGSAVTGSGRLDRHQTDNATDVIGVDGLCPVTVLVACHNEESVVDGLVRAMLALDYPAGLQLVVVDDHSTDATGPRLDALALAEPRLTVVHRSSGKRGKPAALNAGSRVATGEVIVVLDADHLPHADLLLRLVRHFADPSVAAVQGRCVIRNPEDSIISGLVALDYRAGYLVNEAGRQVLVRMPAYGGANCAVRSSDLLAVGGWDEDTVTEDTELTLRLVLSGRRVRYDVSAIDEEEGVTTLSRFWTQRYRWARGHQQVWRDHRRAVWRSSRLSLGEKLETLMFLLAFHVPVGTVLGLSLAVLELCGGGSSAGLDVPVLWTLLFLGPMLELGTGLVLSGAHRRDVWRLVWFLPLLLVSAAVCTKAWFDGILGRPYVWVKTPRAADPDGGRPLEVRAVAVPS